MICELSQDQKKGISIITRNIIENEPLKTSEEILKKVYDVAYHNILKSGQSTKTAQEYGIAMTSFIAETLHEIAQKEKENSILSKMGLDLNNDSTANAIKYTNDAEVKKLVGIKETFSLKRNITEFTKEQEAKLKDVLKSIKDKFPKLGQPTLFKGKSSENILLRTIENNRPLFHVSLFSKDLGPRLQMDSLKNGKIIPDGASFNEALAYGNLMDHSIRTIFQNKNKSFEEVREMMKNDPDMVNAFSAYSLGKSKAEADPKSSPLFNAYFDQFLDDAILTASKIEQAYQGYHITDLSDIIENSSLSAKEKEAFYLYSNKLGLIGELDLLAVKPDGTFKVIDLKTTKGTLLEGTENAYMKQISAYTHMLAEATGLKAEGNGDIFLIQKSYRKVMENVMSDPSGHNKVIITDIQQISKPILSLETLQKNAEDYRKKQLENMMKIDEVTEESKEDSSDDDFILDPMAAFLNSQKKNAGNSDTLNMSLVEGEPLSSKESIKQQAEWLEKVFPELKGGLVQIIPSFMSNKGGEFFLDAILLAQKSNEGVGYHEGWHRFSQLYLTQDEKVKLYKGVQESGITFTDREGNKINAATADFRQTEEFLAEEFRKYAQDPENYKFPSKEVTGIFAKIWQFLKSLLNYVTGSGANAYIKLFQQLHDGNFYRGNFSMDNAFFSHLNSFYRDSKNGGEEVMSNNQFMKYSNFADGYLNEVMMNTGKLLKTYLSQGGIAELTKTLQDGFGSMRQILQNRLKKVDNEQLRQTLDDFNKILGDDKNPGTFEDFMRGYLRTTNFSSLRRYIGANTELAADIINETVLTPTEKAEDEGNETTERNPSDEERYQKEFNRSGNEVSAEELASDLVRDFFNGIPELDGKEWKEGDTYSNHITRDERGMPNYLNKSKAFFKTLEMLEGHFTWDLIREELENSDNYEKFPELRMVHEKLFGKNGIITQLDAISDDIEDDAKNKKYTKDQLKDKLEEQRKLKEFKNQFQHVMTLAKVRYETLMINQEAVDAEPDSTKKYRPIETRENSEAALTHIINDFSNGFHQNAMKEHDRVKDATPFPDLFDAFHSVLSGDKTKMEQLADQKYIYDPVMKTYHFNPFYANKHFGKRISVNDFTTADVKDFLDMYGINMDARSYEKDEKEIRSAFSKLKAVSSAYMNNIVLDVEKMLNTNWNGKSWLKESKNLQDMKQKLKERTEKGEPVGDLETQIFEQQRLLRYKASEVFTTKPVDELLYRDEKRKQDKNTRKDDRYKAFALSLPTFMQLAKVQKNYRKYFSSGSMLVADGTEFSYFLPNQMLLLSKLLQYGVKSYEDFDKYPELQHLNPLRNPQYKNSFIISNMFDPKTGKRLSNYNLSISVLSQISRNDEEGNKEVTKTSETTRDEKLLMDFLTNSSEGSSEIRRLETSNTAYRIALVNNEKQSHKFVKAVVINDDKGFSNPRFTSKVRNHIQAAIWKYVYDLKRETNPKIKGENAKLGIFEEMLGDKVTKELKKHIHSFLDSKAEDYDWNNFFNDIQHSDPFEVSSGDKLFESVNNAIGDYFEKIAITNKDSVWSEMPRILSQKSKKTLINLANNFKGKVLRGDPVLSTATDISEFKTLHNDPKFKNQVRDFIANDFLMTMEDSLLFFGDYTYYKDPIKRRKIIGNNGNLAIADKTDARIEKMQAEKGGLQSVWMEHKGITDMNKDYSLIRKTLLKDKELVSKLIEDGTLIKDLKDFYSQFRGKSLSDEEIKSLKTNVISAFSKMEAADAGAYVSLDLYRRMRQKADNWSESDQREFERQKLIMKQKLGHDYSGKEEEKKEDDAYIAGGPYSSFNIAKFALTGPVYQSTDEKGVPLRPTFDKMGLKVMMPETDWDSKRYLFQHMLENAVDYMVYDSGSKGYQTDVHDVWNQDGTPKKADMNYAEHAGGFMKLQQNTTAVKDQANFAVQLRGTFFSIMMLHQKNGVVDPELNSLYHSFLGSLKDYITQNSNKELASIGLDKSGNFLMDGSNPVGKKKFVDKIREKLLQLGSTDLSLLDKLNVSKSGDFVHFLESLPLSKDIQNIVSGILDDGLRKVKMNGSKMYQTMELGSSKLKGDTGGTLGLKWHGLIRDKDGNITGVAPVECKIAFKENFKPLLQLTGLDGAKVTTLERLNAAMNSEAWREANKESLTIVGIRIPLQDMNFTSHMIVRQFMPESEGDTIIVPPEFYKQVGSDNDIDTITTTFPYLDKETGKPIARPKESYEEITNKLSELREKLASMKNKIVKPKEEFKSRMDDIRERIIQSNMFANAGKSTSDIDEELTLEDVEGQKVLSGLKSSKSVLGKAMKKGMYSDIMEDINELVDDMNKGTSDSININPVIRELKEWSKKERAYKKGINNDILAPMVKFLSHPQSFDYLTETDSIAPIEDMARDMKGMRDDVSPESIDLNGSKSALNDIGYNNNNVNHGNNFQVRTMLGAFVKFSRLLTTLVQTGTHLNQKYISSSQTNLANFEGSLKAVKDNLPKGFYERHIWTPLLTTKTNGKIKLGLYDEKGERINKNLSMIASSLLDLFKNIGTFPNLGITWNNIKPMIFMMTQGVPMKKAISFLNNPIVKIIEENKNEMGNDYQLRHAIVKTSQYNFGDAIHPMGPANAGLWEYNQTDEYGKETANTYMARQGKGGEDFLFKKFQHNINDFRLDQDKVDEFSKAFYKFRKEKGLNSTSDLRTFITSKEGSQYKDLAEDLMAYYSTLVEDGDNFYQMVIKKLDRDAVKYNNQTQIADSNRSERALKQSGLVNSDFHKKIKEDSVFSPFYNDHIVENAMQAILPHIYDKEIKGWVDGIKGMLARVSGELYSSEDKRRVEGRIISDLMENIYKNFFVMNWERNVPVLDENGKPKLDEKGNPTMEKKVFKNFLYEYFEKDIIPELSLPQISSLLYKDGNVVATNKNLTDLKGKVGVDNFNFLSAYTSFANQIDLIRAKYPELATELKMFQALQSKRSSPQLEYEPPMKKNDEEDEDEADQDFDPEQPLKNNKKERNITISEIFNMFSQIYMNMNLTTDPQTKFVDEQQVRDEWKKMMGFTPKTFPALYQAAVKNGRLDIYTNPDNQEELKSFAHLLGYYALVQNSHMDKSNGSFAHLAPDTIIQEVVENSLKNFKESVKTMKQDKIEKFLSDFENTFRQMNPDMGLKIGKKGEVGYKRDKVKSGKLYSKTTLANETFKGLKQRLLEDTPGETGHNNFIINNDQAEKNALNDNKNCN